ncbi:GNAT family N-acetyltransferase [bacterium]|nr:GNAT family N-acetyltransferase [bacterium]
MTEQDLELAVAWAAEEGWNPGLRDAACFHAADPEGFFMAYLGDRPAGSISAVAYDDSFGFMGFYIVRPDLRGHGVGMELWKAATRHMGERNIGGDGVVAMLDKYRQSGFAIAHRNIRFRGSGTAAVESGDVVDISRVPFAELLSYDRARFPASRPEFLARWINQPEGGGRALLRNGRLAGYGVIRACHCGFKIAPLFADDPQAAEELFTSLAGLAPGVPVYLDVPEPNAAALALADRHGMTSVFETARIYTRGAPELPLAEIYGITSFELG